MKTIFFLLWLALFVTAPVYGEMYKWVDEKGTVHFTDDPSMIPEKYQPHSEIRKAPRESSRPEAKEEPPSNTAPSVPSKGSEPKGFEVPILRRHELLFAEVLLNNRVRKHFIIDTGASFTLIDKQTANDLGLVVDENTPFLMTSSVTDVVLTPLVTLKSVQVGEAAAENVEALIYTMASGGDGLLGNSFLNKFRVVLDSLQGKMTLYSLQGESSPDRPGGFARDYWTGRFRFYHQVLAQLKKLKVSYESRGARPELNRVNNAIRYFENQLSELERRASFAGVPRNWRE